MVAWADKGTAPDIVALTGDPRDNASLSALSRHRCALAKRSISAPPGARSFSTASTIPVAPTRSSE